MPDASLLDDHFRKPRNAGVLEGADLEVRADNPVCGDTLLLYLKRGADGRVAACKFQAYGCPASIAVGSLLTELVLGKSPGDLQGLTEEAISNAMQGLGPDKRHAAALAGDAIRAALASWNPTKRTS